jgi:transforming growth factor-beta-induced protein
MRKLWLFLPLLSVLLFACKDDEDDDKKPATNNIVDVAKSNAQLSSLVSALTDSRHTTNFVEVLSGTGPFTVFAPNNAAFDSLLAALGVNSIGAIDIATLNSVLLHHVINGEVKAADLTEGYVKTLATGPNNENISLFVDLSNGVQFNGNASPVTTDVDADNGVVHVIDAVMLPPNIVQLALANPNFSTLVAALTDSRHTTNFAEVLSGDGPFTVFAPTNAAFQALLTALGASTLADVDIATLDAVLKYHVIGSANVQSDQLTNGQTVTTLQGGNLTVNLASGAKLITASNDTVNIVATDVQGTNGVIHVVDQVLLFQ